MKKELDAIATLTGTVIGAGILGIPYVIANAGFLTGLFDIVFLGIIVIILYLYYGEVVLRTREIHQLTGYAEKYLGTSGKVIGTIVMLVGIYAALIAYLIGVGASISALIGGSRLFYSTLFLFFCGSLVYVGISAVERSELIIGAGIIITILLISALSFKDITASNLSEFSLPKLLQPYGVILFAYLGTAAIPEMRIELKKNEKFLKKTIILGMVIPVLVYTIFSLTVVGVVGRAGFSALDPNNRIATIALRSHIGQHLYIIANIFGIFAMTTSFLSLALALKEMFVYDFNLGTHKSMFLTLALPFVFALLNLADFIEVISFSGVFVSSLNALLIVLMYWKARETGNRKPEYSIRTGKWLGVVLILLFILGLVHRLL